MDRRGVDRGEEPLGCLRRQGCLPRYASLVVHEAEEGGHWAEVPALPGCVSQGETMAELLANVREAIQAWLDAGSLDEEPAAGQRVVEVALRSGPLRGTGTWQLEDEAGRPLTPDPPVMAGRRAGHPSVSARESGWPALRP
jgi:predicted RNase H-like HicB family nuclease